MKLHPNQPMACPDSGTGFWLVDGVSWRNPSALIWTRLDELNQELDPKGREEDL